MAKGSALSRAIRYFKDADIEEVKFVLQRGQQIVQEREPKVAAAKAPKARRPHHKPKPAHVSEQLGFEDRQEQRVS